MVQNASKNMLLFVDEKRSAAYNEGRIDAELKAARESVENLAIHKAAIIERRYLIKLFISFCLHLPFYSFLYLTVISFLYCIRFLISKREFIYE